MGWREFKTSETMIKDLQSKREILFSKRLCCYPAVEEAAKEFAKFISEHPEYSVDDVRCFIEEKEREEDHYGNGGGIDRTLIIYKERLETQDEYNARIRVEEDNIITRAKGLLCDIFYKIKGMTKELPSDQRVYNEITNYMQNFITNYNG